MARKPSGSPTAGSPPVTDNFSLITGIGPVLSQRLHKAGIYTYTQLATLSPAALAKKVSGLSAKQITKQDWTGQAHKLAPKKTQSKPHRKEDAKRTIRQHYVNFTIEFLMDEKNRIRCTRVIHVQSGDADTWAGWEGDQLVDFLARHAGVRIPAKRFDLPENSTVHRQSLGNSGSGVRLTEIKQSASLPPLSEKYETAQSSTEINKTVLQSPANGNFAGILRLQDFKVLLTGSETPLHSLRQDQACHVQLTVDLKDVAVRNNVPLRYQATITFKQFGGASYLVAEESNTVNLSDCIRLDIPCTSPPPGLYRPDALVNLFSGETTCGLIASLKGELIQVF